MRHQEFLGVVREEYECDGASNCFRMMMAIAICVDSVGHLSYPSKESENVKRLKMPLYLEFKDYIILTVALMLMSLLIANRYWAKFSRSRRRIFIERVTKMIAVTCK